MGDRTASSSRPNGRAEYPHSGYPKAIVLWTVGVLAFIGGFYDGSSIQEPGAFSSFYAIAVFVAVWLWIHADRGRHRGVAEQYGGFGFYLLWPVLLPFYLIQTRGWRRSGRALLLVALVWIGTAILGYSVGAMIPQPG